jgi:uncharacterized protein
VASATSLGVDLAGLEHRETGIAVLKAGRLVYLGSAGPDVQIFNMALCLGLSVPIAINAPLTLPRGRCCLDDDCRCRHDPGTRSREVERALARERVPTLATALIKVLARRGIRLAAALRAQGFTILEAYPFATLRLLGLPSKGKRSRAGRAVIRTALADVLPGLDHPDATEHQLDAVVCALTANLWQRGLCRLVGDPDEGQMIVPVADAAELIRAATTPLVNQAVAEQPLLKRAADEAGPYVAGPLSS